MMPLESQLTSFEISKKMKGLGFPQDSYFIWILHPINGQQILNREQYLELFDIGQYETVSAYSVAELLEIMPKRIHSSDGKDYFLHIANPIGSISWDVWYEHLSLVLHMITDKKLSNSLGKMAIYLKENGLLEDHKK